jgi:hypothetical protein
MVAARCLKCNSRLIAEAKDGGNTELHCPRLRRGRPLKTDAAKWAESSLAQPSRAEGDDGRRVLRERARHIREFADKADPLHPKNVCWISRVTTMQW